MQPGQRLQRQKLLREVARLVPEEQNLAPAGAAAPYSEPEPIELHSACADQVHLGAAICRVVPAPLLHLGIRRPSSLIACQSHQHAADHDGQCAGGQRRHGSAGRAPQVLAALLAASGASSNAVQLDGGVLWDGALGLPGALGELPAGPPPPAAASPPPPLPPPLPHSPCRPDWALAGAVAVVFGAQRLVPTFKPDWYRALRKPSWTPPNWVFPAVWIPLKLLQSAALWLVWRAAPGPEQLALPLTLFGMHMFLGNWWNVSRGCRTGCLRL